MATENTTGERDDGRRFCAEHYDRAHHAARMGGPVDPTLCSVCSEADPAHEDECPNCDRPRTGENAAGAPTYCKACNAEAEEPNPLQGTATMFAPPISGGAPTPEEQIAYDEAILDTLPPHSERYEVQRQRIVELKRAALREAARRERRVPNSGGAPQSAEEAEHAAMAVRSGPGVRQAYPSLSGDEPDRPHVIIDGRRFNLREDNILRTPPPGEARMPSEEAIMTALYEQGWEPWDIDQDEVAWRWFLDPVDERLRAPIAGGAPAPGEAGSNILREITPGNLCDCRGCLRVGCADCQDWHPPSHKATDDEDLDGVVLAQAAVRRASDALAEEATAQNKAAATSTRRAARLRSQSRLLETLAREPHRLTVLEIVVCADLARQQGIIGPVGDLLEAEAARRDEAAAKS